MSCKVIEAIGRLTSLIKLPKISPRPMLNNDLVLVLGGLEQQRPAIVNVHKLIKRVGSLASVVYIHYLT